MGKILENSVSFDLTLESWKKEDLIHYILKLEEYLSRLLEFNKEILEKILNEIYTLLWEDTIPIQNTFINLDIKIRDIATRFSVNLKD